MHGLLRQLIACLLTLGPGASTAETAPDPAPQKTIEITEHILFDKNVAIVMDDGVALMANVFRPKAPGRYPVLMSMSVYGKDVHTRDFNEEVWEHLVSGVDGLCEVSSCEYHAWETPDPEVWVPEGYVVIRIDARGSGKSEGVLDVFSPRETRDYYQAIEWAGTRPWSNGRVGLAGISYFAINQWQVAALRPPHLAAIAPWEGAVDSYRDMSRHGGILSNVFYELWSERQVIPIQHGNADSPFRDMDDGTPVGGALALSDEQLAANRVDSLSEALAAPLDGPYYRSRTPQLEDIEVPILSAANWGGFGLHSRGNFAGFTDSGSAKKWLVVHSGDHNSPFYRKDGTALLEQFYAQYLKGEDTGWEARAPVTIDVRHPDGTIERREEQAWPIPRTKWRRLYLDADGDRLAEVPPTADAEASYEALREPVVFRTPPLSEALELTGPMMSKLYVSSSTEDMDLFVTVQAFAPDGTEVSYEGASEPAAPIAQGWLRVSHRKLDPARSKPWQPYHSHDERQLLEPGRIYEVDVEIWPGQTLLPEGYRLALRVEGEDFVRPRPGVLGWLKDRIMGDLLGINVLAGSGLFLHNHPDDRPEAVFGGRNTIHTGGAHASHLMIPVVP